MIFLQNCAPNAGGSLSGTPLLCTCPSPWQVLFLHQALAGGPSPPRSSPCLSLAPPGCVTIVAACLAVCCLQFGSSVCRGQAQRLCKSQKPKEAKGKPLQGQEMPRGRLRNAYRPLRDENLGEPV